MSDKMQELIEVFRRRADEHKSRAQIKDGEISKNYHLGYADAYEVCADDLELTIDND